VLIDAGKESDATVLVTVTVDVADVALAPFEPGITLVTVSVLVTVIAFGLFAVLRIVDLDVTVIVELAVTVLVICAATDGQEVRTLLCDEVVPRDI
jgi:hypothetical protein